MNWRDCITIDPDVYSGEPMFRGTDLPVSRLFYFLEVGKTRDEFLDKYTEVSREQVEALLSEEEEVRRVITEAAASRRERLADEQAERVGKFGEALDSYRSSRARADGAIRDYMNAVARQRGDFGCTQSSGREATRSQCSRA